MSDAKPYTAEELADIEKTSPWDGTQNGHVILLRLLATLRARDADLARLKAECDQWRTLWEDADDEWTSAIREAHPTRSESHDEYGVAMRMVGARYSKGALVALVNWLLVRLRTDGGGR